MTELRVEVKQEDIDRLIKKAGAIGAFDTMQRSLNKGALFLIGWIVKNRFIGPRGSSILKTKTGRLRSSIVAFNLVSDREHQFSIRIGTNVEYAAKHEFGFTGREQVRAHIRKHTEKVRFNLPGG